MDLGQHLPFHHSSNHFNIPLDRSHSIVDVHRSSLLERLVLDLDLVLVVSGSAFTARVKSMIPTDLSTSQPFIGHIYGLSFLSNCFCGAWEQVYAQGPGVNEGAAPEHGDV